MNPPVNRENLRDVLIALIVAIGVARAIGTVRGCAARTSASVPSIVAQLVQSRTR
jgi:hypothetical protein